MKTVAVEVTGKGLVAELRDINPITTTVDELGTIRREIELLKTREKELADLIKDQDEDKIEAPRFTATVVVADRNVTDWKGIATKMGASRQIITANTVVKTVTSVRTKQNPGHWG